MRLAAIALFGAACTEPVVDMEFQIPINADRYDTSCVTAIEVRAIGTNVMQDPADYTRSCIDVSGAATYSAIRDTIRGQFALDIPDSGLSGISMLGWSGPGACAQSDKTDYFTPDLMFFAKGEYIGQDSIDVFAWPNLNCARTQVKARIIDMFELVTTGAAGCTAAMTYPDEQGSVGVGTIMPKLFGKGSAYYGGLSWGLGVANVAAFDARTDVGPKSCFAVDGGSATAGGSTSCLVAGNICAGAGEIEVAAVADAIIQATPNFDPALMSKFPGIIYGSVWSSAKAPVAGATLEIDAAHGKVIYIDPPDAGSGLVKARADQSGTGPLGLFVVFTDTLSNVKVNAGGKSRTITVGATDDAVAGAMVLMP